MTDAAKKDIFAIMDRHPGMYQTVRMAILTGKIFGVCPNLFGGCGCVKAHIRAELGDVEFPSYIGLRVTPIETYVLNVTPNQTPTVCERLQNVVWWLDEWKAKQAEVEFQIEEEFEI